MTVLVPLSFVRFRTRIIHRPAAALSQMDPTGAASRRSGCGRPVFFFCRKAEKSQSLAAKPRLARCHFLTGEPHGQGATGWARVDVADAAIYKT